MRVPTNLKNVRKNPLVDGVHKYILYSCCTPKSSSETLIPSPEAELKMYSLSLVARYLKSQQVRNLSDTRFHRKFVEKVRKSE